MNVSEKRNVPAPIRKLLSMDAICSEHFCLWANQYLPFRSLQRHYKMLEVSCHGIPWLCGWLAFIWLANASSLYAMQVNFYIGLVLDIVFVAILKALVRRRRPQGTTPDMFDIGPDKYSFPSGHASRAVFIAYFLIVLYPLPLIILPALAWAVSVSVSRILLKRHHILDVFCGALLGILEGIFVGQLWLSHETSTSILSWLTDEKLEGGEYHV